MTPTPSSSWLTATPGAWAQMTQLLEAKMLEIGDDMLHWP